MGVFDYRSGKSQGIVRISVDILDMNPDLVSSVGEGVAGGRENCRFPLHSGNFSERIVRNFPTALQISCVLRAVYTPQNLKSSYTYAWSCPARPSPAFQ